MKRRNFLKTLGTLAGGSALAGLYAWQIEPFWLEFVKEQMPVKNLPDNLIGKTVMQISDVHVGNRFDYQFLIESFQEAQALCPDFVVYTGDFVHYEDETQIEQLTTVFEHAVKGTLGTFGVLGNHDYGHNWDEEEVAVAIKDVLKESGVSVLRNEQIEANGINFIGIDELYGTNFNPSSVLDNLDSGKANITLCHNPDVADLDVWNDYDGWILSGHTHGGQVRPPLLDPPLLPVKNKAYNAGKINLEDGRTLYINRALGHLLQVRFNVRPEITLFNLEQA